MVPPSSDHGHRHVPKLNWTLYRLDETGDLQRLVREVVATDTLFKDDDKRMRAEITTWLDNFTMDGAVRGCQNGSGGGT